MLRPRAAVAAAGGAGGGVGDAGAHRYWRIEDIVVGGNGDNFEVSEIQLWYANARVSGSATLSSPAATGVTFSGTANLSDNSTANAGSAVSANGPVPIRHNVTYVFDFGVGNTQFVDAVKFGAFDTAARYPSAFTLSYSDDNSTWTGVARVTGLSYPGNNTLSAQIATVPKGVLTSPATFTYLRKKEQFIVPGGVTTMSAKCWGAGGGAYASGTTGNGGGGGYATASFAVTPGETLDIYVGEGGGAGPAARYGAAGGGCSGVYRGSTPLVVAGGGGGGSEGSAGGAGGGSSGADGSNATASGKGGTSSAAGAAGTAGSGRPAGSAGSGANGGNGAVSAGTVGTVTFGFGTGGAIVYEPGDGGGGGGGGGYYGGGGGSVSGGGIGQSGGGGSGYAPGGTNTAGSGTTPGNSGDGDRNGAGDGGSSSARRGADGRVILSWS